MFISLYYRVQGVSEMDMKWISFEGTNLVVTVHLDISGHRDDVQEPAVTQPTVSFATVQKMRFSLTSKESQRVACFTHTVNGLYRKLLQCKASTVPTHSAAKYMHIYIYICIVCTTAFKHCGSLYTMYAVLTFVNCN